MKMTSNLSSKEPSLGGKQEDKLTGDEPMLSVGNPPDIRRYINEHSMRPFAGQVAGYYPSMMLDQLVRAISGNSATPNDKVVNLHNRRSHYMLKHGELTFNERGMFNVEQEFIKLTPRPYRWERGRVEVWADYSDGYLGIVDLDEFLELANTLFMSDE
jgi:hypothetical protein